MDDLKDEEDVRVLKLSNLEYFSKLKNFRTLNSSDQLNDLILVIEDAILYLMELEKTNTKIIIISVMNLYWYIFISIGYYI